MDYESLIPTLGAMQRLVLLIWRSGGMGGGLVASPTGKRPLWVGTNRPRKRVDVVGMRKILEMGETRV